MIFCCYWNKSQHHHHILLTLFKPSENTVDHACLPNLVSLLFSLWLFKCLVLIDRLYAFYLFWISWMLWNCQHLWWPYGCTFWKTGPYHKNQQDETPSRTSWTLSKQDQHITITYAGIIWYYGSELHQLLQKRYVWHEPTMRRQWELWFVNHYCQLLDLQPLIPGTDPHPHGSRNWFIIYDIPQLHLNTLPLHHSMEHHPSLQNPNKGCHLSLILQFCFQTQISHPLTMNSTIFYDGN